MQNLALRFAHTQLMASTLALRKSRVMWNVASLHLSLFWFYSRGLGADCVVPLRAFDLQVSRAIYFDKGVYTGAQGPLQPQRSS